ncbi:splicing factor ESS-2 homolog [Branchiostoma lanceolatum]|uniref:splicing factor ESS-2 homolog n=1 Tax=Branchiostoma lanceolatum TaxID=7740 RepID=UPI0034546751
MALVKKDEKSMAVSTQVGGEGGKTKKPPKKVLDEDTYVKDLETIIQRDFFPDLTKLKAQQEYMEAVETNDHQKMRELAIKYGSTRLTTRLRTETPWAPGAYTPATFETPDVDSSRVRDSPASHRSAVNHSQPEGEGPPEKKAKQDTDLPLDKYLSKNTSEDNASFGTIMEVTEDKNRQRHSWLYDAEKEHAEKQKEILQLKGPEQLAIEGSTSSVDTWSYKAKNALMYYPEGTDSEEDVFKKPREILHKNTRLVRSPFDSDVAKSRLHQVAGVNAQIKKGKIGHDGKEILPEDTPKVNGFGFVATPSPAPGVDESPLMTWGEIEGTPFRLDGSDTPAPTTPGFKINEPRKRERLGRALVEKIGKSHRAKKEDALKRMTASFASPTPTFGSLKSMDRVNTMSPAAQRLINRTSSRGSSTDKALRASYSPSPARSGAGNTPIRLTPRNTPLSVRRSPRHSKTPTLTSASSSTDTSSLSDNLLNLPNTRPTRKKATDFF